MRGRAKTFTLVPMLVFAAWCSLAGAQDETRGLSKQELAALLEESRAEKRIPGLRAAIRYPDGRIVRAAVGLGDREAGTPLDDTVGMPGGSTGKTFVAALTMLLVEDGTLSLDDPISKWVGNTAWYPRLPGGEHIRVRHLLSHSSGIPDWPDSGRFTWATVFRVLGSGSARFEPEELIDYSITGKKPPFAPGKGYRYSDTGYLILGRVIEAAGGRAYYDLVQGRILDPLALEDIRPQSVSVLPNIVPGYWGGRSRCLKKDGRMKIDPSSEWTGGGLVTTPTMLVRFYGALAEGRVVKPESLAAMLEGEWQGPHAKWRYGYGLFVYDDGKDLKFGHAGLWSAYRSDVTHFTSSGLTIAVQANRDGDIGLDRLIERLASVARTDGPPASLPSGPTGRLSRDRRTLRGAGDSARNRREAVP